jgi:hypothetical protein
MVEWLVYGAWKLLQPVAERVLADAQQGAADWAETKATEWVRRVITSAGTGPHPTGADSGDVATVGEAVGAKDGAIVTALEQDPSTTEDLRQGAEKVLGVSLSGPEVIPGSDAWFVSAYEALLWRAAVMAGWEGRPIAVAGALQGPGWVTVCVLRRSLRAGQVIEPSSLWERTRTADVLRSSSLYLPADFFVRRVGEDEDATQVAAVINRRSARTYTFDPGSVGPGRGMWHRVDGLSRTWVRFEWDDFVARHVVEQRPDSAAKLLLERGTLDERVIYSSALRLTPPEFDEFPENWQEEMDIPDEVTAIGTLSEGLDNYAAASMAILTAARSVLNRAN